jgi:GT2 family glycosyltransferase
MAKCESESASGKRIDSFSVIVVTHNSTDCLYHCLASLEKPQARAWISEIIIVNNCSLDRLRDRAPEFPASGFSLLELGKNRGYGAACNAGAAQSKGESLLFLNADIEVESDALEQLALTFRAYEQIGVIGFRLREADRDPAPSRFRFPKGPWHILANLIVHPSDLPPVFVPL